jgi:hypothetical protein
MPTPSLSSTPFSKWIKYSPLHAAQHKVYLIEPSCDYKHGHVYVGHSTLDLSDVLRDFQMIHLERKRRTYMTELFNTYGITNFRIHLLETAKDEQEAIQISRRYIQRIKSVNYVV